MLNPYTVFSCIAKTTSVFNNLFLALCLYAMVKRKFNINCNIFTIKYNVINIKYTIKNAQ